MERYFSQYCPSKFASTNVRVNYLPWQIRISGTIAAAILYALEIAGTFLGHSGELCGAEITGPKTFFGTFAVAKIITGTVFDLCSPLYHHALHMRRTLALVKWSNVFVVTVTLCASYVEI